MCSDLLINKMPRISAKEQICDLLIKNAINSIQLIEDIETDSDDAVDEVMDVLCEDLLYTLAHRKGIEHPLPKSTNWREDILSSIDDGRFRQMVRVGRTQFAHLLSLIQNDENFETSHSTLQFPVSVQLAIVLFRLGSSGESASVRKIAATFGVGDGGTLDKITLRVFGALLRLFTTYVFWPNALERAKIVEDTFHELPYCIGYVDGSEINLSEMPVSNPEQYFSRKQRYSTKVQVICDHKLKIRDVVVGNPGSFHDAKIFKNSNVFKYKENFFSPRQYVAGDSAYPLSSVVVTPYRSNSRLLDHASRVRFNKRHSQYRVRVENCFGMLKERFCSLKELRIRMKDEKSQKICCQWIMVCCLLHNILINDQELENFSQYSSNYSEQLDEIQVSPDEGETNDLEVNRQSLFNLMFN